MTSEALRWEAEAATAARPPGSTASVHERWTLLLEQQRRHGYAQRLEDAELQMLLIAENQMLRERIFALEGAGGYLAGGSSAPYMGPELLWSRGSGRDASPFANPSGLYGGGQQHQASYRAQVFSGGGLLGAPNPVHMGELPPRARTAACRAGQSAQQRTQVLPRPPLTMQLSSAPATASAYAQLPRAAAQPTSLRHGMPMAVAVCVSGAGGPPATAAGSSAGRKRTAMDELPLAAAAFAARPPLGGPGMMPAAGTANAAARNWACGRGISPGMAPSSEAACNWASGQRSLLESLPGAGPAKAACNWALGHRGAIGSPGMMHDGPAAPAAEPADATAWDLGHLGTIQDRPEFSVDDLGLDEPSPSSGLGASWAEPGDASGARHCQAFSAGGAAGLLGGGLTEGPSGLRVRCSDQ